MKSPQEVLLTELSQASVGFDYVFEPNEYRKGNAKREPADLVWACNDCLILLYMAQRMHKTRTPEAHNSMRHELIKHNLGQAKGWLSEWRTGSQNLVGANPYRKFNIRYGQYKYVVVLSVLDCNDDIGEYHESFVAKQQVTLCATLPQNVLLKLARHGGSLIDVVHVIKVLQALKRMQQPRVENLTSLVEAHLAKVATAADPERKWLTGNGDAITQQIDTTLRILRSPGSSRQSTSLGTPTIDEQKPWDVGDVLNDIGVSGIYLIITQLRQAIFASGPESQKTVHHLTQVADTYTFLLTATTFMADNAVETNGQASEAAINHMVTHSSSGGMIVLWDTYLKKPIATAVMPRKGPSAVEKMITKDFEIL